jgi:hypothetical protein
MCYTANDSLIAYIINSISSILLYNVSKDDQYKVIALFLLFVGQMQIFDFAFWKNQSCNLTNYLSTKGAITFNHLQPIILYYLQTTYGFKQSLISQILFGLYVFVAIFYNLEAFSKVNCTLPSKGVMDWKWNKLSGNTLYYFLFIAYLVSASFNFKNPIIQWLLAILTVVSILVATKTPVLNLSIGRIWCYYAAFIPLIFVALSYFNLV